MENTMGCLFKTERKQENLAKVCMVSLLKWNQYLENATLSSMCSPDFSLKDIKKHLFNTTQQMVYKGKNVDIFNF